MQRIIYALPPPQLGQSQPTRRPQSFWLTNERPGQRRDQCRYVSRDPRGYVSNYPYSFKTSAWWKHESISLGLWPIILMEVKYVLSKEDLEGAKCSYCYNHITLDINDVSDWPERANISLSFAKRMLSIIVTMCGRNPILSTNVTLWELHMSLVWWEQSRQLCSVWDLDCVRAEIISNKYAQNTRHVATPLTNFLPLRVGILTRWTEQKKLKFHQTCQTPCKDIN